MFIDYRQQANQEWGQARRKALWTLFRASLSNKKVNLLNFDELSYHFELGNASYRGVQIIPLDKIIGSTGRYRDFVQTFLPVNEEMRERWQRIAAVYLDPDSGGLPAIEVYQVGEYYFVTDGNHRVSVAHQLKLETIDAHVWEYFLPVTGLAPGVDIDTLLLEAERRDFLVKTKLNELWPGHTIRFTVPGGYTQVLGQIARYQEVLSLIDEVEVSYERAVTAWYEMIYQSIAQIIEQEGILKNFPNRTTADFFIWAITHHQELEEQSSQPVMMDEAVKNIKEKHRSNKLVKFREILLGWWQRLHH